MSRSDLTVLKKFARKLSNCRYNVPSETFIDYMKKQRFGIESDSGEETIVTNETLFAQSVEKVIDRIGAILKKPHLFLKGEEIVQNVSVASHMNNEMVRKNCNDSRYWVDPSSLPEKVYSVVYEDDYAIYENRFLTFLIDRLYVTLARKIDEIKASITPLAERVSLASKIDAPNSAEFVDYADSFGGVPVLLPGKDSKVMALCSYIRSRKKLGLYMHSEVYKACKRTNPFDIKNLRPTNIILNDGNYNYCYLFFLNYLKPAAQEVLNYDAYNSFAIANLLVAIDASGFVQDSADADIEVEDFVSIKFSELVFRKAPFKLTLKQNAKDAFDVRVLNTTSGSFIKYSFKSVCSADPIFNDGAATLADIAEGFYEETQSSYRSFIITDMVEDGDGIISLIPDKNDYAAKLEKLVKSFVYLAEGSLPVYARVCPICGSSLVVPDTKDFTCINCNSVYNLFHHDMKDYIWIKTIPGLFALTPSAEDLPEIEEPVIEQIVAEEPIVEEAVEEAVIEEPVVEEPVVEEPVVEEPAIEEPVVEEPVVEEPVVEEAAIEEPAVEEAAIEEPAVEETTTEEPAAEEAHPAIPDASEYNKVKKHFMARLSQTTDDKKEFYNDLKNYILSHKDVNARMSWHYETFNSHREPKVRLSLRGKTLVAYFALDIKDYEDSKYFPQFVGGVKKFDETPMMVKVKSARGVKGVKELIDVVLAGTEKKKNYKPEDFKPETKTDEELYAEGLVKYVTEKSFK